MINNDIELEGTLERINHFRQIVMNIRKTEKNPENYRASAGGFLAEIDRMNFEVREYLSLHPSDLNEEQGQVAA
jgi:hypothetical protein